MVEAREIGGVAAHHDLDLAVLLELARARGERGRVRRGGGGDHLVGARAEVAARGGARRRSPRRAGPARDRRRRGSRAGRRGGRRRDRSPGEDEQPVTLLRLLSSEREDRRALLRIEAGAGPGLRREGVEGQLPALLGQLSKSIRAFERSGSAMSASARERAPSWTTVPSTAFVGASSHRPAVRLLGASAWRRPGAGTARRGSRSRGARRRGGGSEPGRGAGSRGVRVTLDRLADPRR